MNGVYKIAAIQFGKVKCNFPVFEWIELKEVILTAALYHDFGKATSYFQDYIQNPVKPSNYAGRMKRRHGLISAIATYQTLKKKYSVDSILPVFGFIIVRRHHGNLADYRTLLTIKEEEIENCHLQANHIDYEEFRQIVKRDDIDKNLVQSFLYPDLRAFRRKDREFTSEHYFILNLLYSILLQADKTDAIFNGKNVQESEILTSKNVLEFKNGLNNNPKNAIDSIRENSFQSVEKTIDSLESSKRILSINIPTGSGKTITSLNASLKLCEKFGHDHIVYCLPFTSVIDQNFKVFDDICKSADLPTDSGVLLKHHHLTDINYVSITDENVVKEYLPNESLHLIEGWESRIIVTTFVQFILSLISYKNAALRKFHRFSNAVIILDEVQTIPHHYWNLIKKMLSDMSEWLNTRIVLVTATMPLIFSEQEDEITELVTGKKEMFACINRIELDVSNLQNEKMEWGEFCGSAVKLVKDNQIQDILFVMNTVRSAQELFHVFSDSIVSHELMFLSAHVIPKHRLQRIDDIKKRSHNKPILVVSTQLVEAGVDIDLDIVVRDFAPLDSIFQTCGRCNRENRDGIKGKVVLFSITDSNGRIPSNIYNSFLKQKTKKVLNGKEIIPESDFYNIANAYFQEVQSGGSQNESYTLIEKIEKLKYADGDQVIEMKLIDDNYSSSVFIEFDVKAVNYWNKYRQILELVSGFEKNAALKQARRNLAEYIINIPKKCLPDGYNNGIYHLCKDHVKEYYDQVTGFKLDKQLPQKTETGFY